VYPHIAAVAAHLPAIDDPENYRTVIQALIDAVRCRAESYSPPRAAPRGR
jgi:hypothetical protein